MNQLAVRLNQEAPAIAVAIAEPLPDPTIVDLAHLGIIAEVRADLLDDPLSVAERLTGLLRIGTVRLAT